MSNKKDFVGGGDQESQSDGSLDAVQADARRMAREVKIGVGLIAVLLVVFAVALYHRLSGSPDDSLAVAAESATSDAVPISLAETASQSATTAEVVQARPGSLRGSPQSPETKTFGKASDSAASAEVDSAEQAPRPTLTYMPVQSDEDGQEQRAGRADQASEDQSGVLSGAQPQQSAATEAPLPVVPLSPAPDQARGTAQAQTAIAQSAPSFSVSSASGSAISAEQRPADTSGPSAWSTAQASGRPFRDATAQPGLEGSMARQQAGGGGASSHATFKAPESPDTAAAAPDSRFAPQQSAFPPGDTGLSMGGAGAAFVSAARDGKYVVQPNDNYWVISEKVYGTGAFFRALAEHNRRGQPDPNRLELGAEISVPPIEELEKRYPDLCPKPEHRQVAARRQSVMHAASHVSGARVYVVQPGDTLFDIARHELGKASRYAEIIQLNRDVLGEQFDYLTPGMKLILPDDGDSPAGQVTQRAEDVYHR